MGGQSPWAVIEEVYAIWEEWGRIDEYPTHEEAARIVDRVKGIKVSNSRVRGGGIGQSVYRWVKQHNHDDLATSVQEYLTDRKKWSPYIDDVAVRRAVSSLDYSDYQALTRRERLEMSRRLAATYDPFDFEAANSLRRPWGTAGLTQRVRTFRTTWPERERREMVNRVNRTRMRYEGVYHAAA